MENCLQLRATKDVVEKILAKHRGKNYFQCGNCYSIKSDAKELARTLYAIARTSIDSEDESLEMLKEECSNLLGQIIVIGMPEECYTNYEFYTKWIKENGERYLPELDDYIDGDVFIKSHDVILKADSDCGCLKLPLTKERQMQYMK